MTARIHLISQTSVSRPFSPGLDCSPLYDSGVKKWVARTLGWALRLTPPLWRAPPRAPMGLGLRRLPLTQEVQL